MVLATAAVLYLVTPVLYFGYEVGLYAFTQKNETIYLTNAQELDPEGDVHAVRGCEALPCSEANTVYFRVRPTLFTHLHSLLDHGDVFYPDRTASVVAPGVNECQVKSYGVRLKFLMRRWDIYPDLLDAVCQPMGHMPSSTN